MWLDVSSMFSQSDGSHYTAMCENNKKVAKYPTVDEWGAKRKGKNQTELYDVEVLKTYENLHVHASAIGMSAQAVSSCCGKMPMYKDVIVGTQSSAGSLCGF